MGHMIMITKAMLLACVTLFTLSTSASAEGVCRDVEEGRDRFGNDIGCVTLKKITTSSIGQNEQRAINLNQGLQGV